MSKKGITDQKRTHLLLAIMLPVVVLLVLITSILIGSLAPMMIYSEILNIMLCITGSVLAVRALRFVKLRYQKFLMVFLVLIFLYLAIVAVFRIIFSGVGAMG